MSATALPAAEIQTAEVRRQHSRISEFRGFLDLAVHVFAIVLVAAAAHRLSHWAGYLSAAAAIGGLQHGLINLGHDAWHWLALRPRWLNDLVGAWFYNYPVGLAFARERRRHLDHHRLVGRLDDPDWGNYDADLSRPPSRLWFHLLARFFGSQVLNAVAKASRARNSKTTWDGPPYAVEAAGILACQAMIFGTFAVFGHWWEYLVLWAGPLLSFASFFVAVRAFVEHATAGATRVEDHLYDFAPSPVEAFFLSPCHFNLHALHHAHPSVPHYRLRRLKGDLASGGVDTYPHKECGSYLRRLLEFQSEIRATNP